MRCYFCDRFTHSTQAACEAGWIPEWFDEARGATCCEPACAACVASRLEQEESGEYVLRGEADPRPDDPPAFLAHRLEQALALVDGVADLTANTRKFDAADRHVADALAALRRALAELAPAATEAAR